MVKPKLFLGLSAVGILLSSLLFAGQKVANDKEGLINDALGLSTKKVSKVGDNVEGSAYTEEDGSLSDASFNRMIKDSYAFCEEAVEQGSALLKNENNCLPLTAEERKVTLFGQGSKNMFMRSGAGGAEPNERLVVTLDKAFANNGFKINKTVWNKYGTVSGMTTPSTQVESASKVCKSSGNELLDDVLASCDEYNDAAIVTFVRIGTENTDPPAKQLDLNSNEQKLLKAIKASQKFSKTIVIINSPLPMSMDWADKEEYGVDAILFMGVPGYYGAGGIVHVLAGEKKLEDGTVVKVNPCGHLVDSFAASASSSAAYQNFGDSNVVVYKEGVYVGYKYYETRYEDCVLEEGNANGNAGTYINEQNWTYADEMGYPFGFGLSYTTFSQTIKSVKYDSETDNYEVTVEVKNTGELDGKASVQVYVQQPYTDFDRANGLGRPAIALMGYEKVDVKAGETVEQKVEFPRYFLATYDYVVKKTYILEGGDYYFAVGNGAHEALNNVLALKAPGKQLTDHLGNVVTGDANAAKKETISQDDKFYSTSVYNSKVKVTNQFDDADYNWYVEKNQTQQAITYLDRQNWQETWPTKTIASPANNTDLNMATKYNPTDEEKDEAGKYTDGKGNIYAVELDEKITFADMANVPLEGKVKEGKFKGQDGEDVWNDFISQMDLDDLIISVSDNRGILGVAKVLKGGNSVAEGPEGLLSHFQYGDLRAATGFPTGPTYTGTWDHAMQKKFGGFFGEEAVYCGVACVNAPGANINRTPYGSRASEYMSEDGIMNYYTASNVVSEARKKGLIMNIKHCFLNNQETGRQGVQTYCNEQAIREIYLKPFEGALTKGNGLGIMTSYNRIGAVYAACHKPLMENVMRSEWNYKGLIIDDALTGNNESNYSNGPAMLYCGTDLFCLDGNRGGQLRTWVKDKDDGLILQKLQRANKYVMYSISRSWMGGLRISEEEIAESVNPWWKKTVKGIVIGSTAVSGALFAAFVVFEVLEKKKLLSAKA